MDNDKYSNYSGTNNINEYQKNPFTVSDNNEVAKQIQVNKDLDVLNMEIKKSPRRERKIREFQSTTYSWTLLWLAIGFTSIVALSAIVLLILYKSGYRPDTVGGGWIAPIVVIPLIWLIMSMIGHGIDGLKDNRVWAIISYVLVIIAFSCIIWWTSFTFLFAFSRTYPQYQYFATNIVKLPLDPLRCFSLVISTAFNALLVWIYYFTIRFMKTKEPLGAGTCVGIGAAYLIAPAIGFYFLILYLYPKSCNIEFFYYSISFTVLFYPIMVWYTVKTKIRDNDGENDKECFEGIYISELIMSAFLVVLTIVVYVIFIIVKVAIKHKLDS